MIFTAADARYIPGALVTLVSALRNSTAREFVLVTSDPDSPWITDEIHNVFSAGNAELRVISAEKVPLSRMRGATSRFPAENFARFFPDCLESNAAYALYVDSDILVLKSLEDISDSVDPGKCLYACADYHGLIKNKPHLNHSRIGLPESEIYYQAGVLLFDVSRFLKSDVREKVEEFLDECGGALSYPDQDALNIVARNHMAPLHPRFNCSPYSWRLLTEAQKKHVAVAHFFGPIKPWHRQAYKIPGDLIRRYDAHVYESGLVEPIVSARDRYYRLRQILFNAKFWCENWIRAVRAQQRLKLLLST